MQDTRVIFGIWARILAILEAPTDTGPKNQQAHLVSETDTRRLLRGGSSRGAGNLVTPIP